VNKKTPSPIKITPHFYQLGTPAFPVYLSLGKDAMIIEGGIGPTYAFIVEQIEDLDIDPKRIKYIALTHTHPDHIGAVPRLKKLWPHLKLVVSPIGAATLRNPDMLPMFLKVDADIANIMLGKGEISEIPPRLDEYRFDVDIEVNEGDRIDLGDGMVWTVYNTPGHSPCHVSYSEEKEGTLVIGDATGFYVPEKHVFWPNYFVSLESYCDSIRKLSGIAAERGALSHNVVVEAGFGHYLKDALAATEAYHNELLTRLAQGEDLAAIAREKGNWVASLTDIQPIEVMLGLSKALIKRSQAEASKPDLFAPAQIEYTGTRKR
jgi:glyoxylase-like metal-dependent hydrolase (beta-lactamase superfamily II)